MRFPLTIQSRVAASKNQVSSNLDGEIVVLGLNKGVYYGLNPVASFVWGLIQDRPRRIEEILAAIQERYLVDPRKSEKDLDKLIGELHTQGLVEVRRHRSSS